MLDSLPEPSPLLFWGFVVLPLLMAAGIVVAIGRCVGAVAGRIAAVVAVVWIGLTGVLGWGGHLDVWAPPRMFFLLAPNVVFLAWAGRSSWAERLGDLPIKLLVGFQSFRIVVELLLHAAVLEGVAHPNMTWSGTNLDIVPGVTALLLVPFVPRMDRRWLQLWNLSMAGVLVVTVVTAVVVLISRRQRHNDADTVRSEPRAVSSSSSRQSEESLQAASCTGRRRKAE